MLATGLIKQQSQRILEIEAIWTLRGFIFPTESIDQVHIPNHL